MRLLFFYVLFVLISVSNSKSIWFEESLELLLGIRNCIPQEFLTYVDNILPTSVDYLEYRKEIEAIGWDTFYRDMASGSLTFCQSYKRMIKTTILKFLHKLENQYYGERNHLIDYLKNHNVEEECEVLFNNLNEDEKEQFSSLLSSGIKCMRKYQKKAIASSVLYSHKYKEE
jgi:hypothetical protein